ncbi:Uncharacterized protein APZ42_013284 [Daphnia magna]|uniref:Uncharacterized protein n=1 Tax=Daphnia magna TaxID=35525 RepID=A0A0P6HE51_9CRUS|nr:Uncharacterized protein APZ42_013284 [Daphnia magna]
MCQFFRGRQQQQGILPAATVTNQEKETTENLALYSGRSNGPPAGPSSCSLHRCGLVLSTTHCIHRFINQLCSLPIL